MGCAAVEGQLSLTGTPDSLHPPRSWSLSQSAAADDFDKQASRGRRSLSRVHPRPSTRPSSLRAIRHYRSAAAQ